MARDDDDPLARLAFDLHDGPLQTLATLRREIGVFRGQLAGAVAGLEDGEKLVGRVDDLAAWAAALDVELRDLVSVARSPELLRGSLVDVLASAVEDARGSCAADLALDPSLTDAPVKDAVRVTLVRIVHAAVSNVAQHSGAARVGVAVNVGPSSLEAEVADAGTGFDVAAAAADAGRLGRLGLAGMRERARRVGGELQIESRPGAGTRVIVRLPLA